MQYILYIILGIIIIGLVVYYRKKTKWLIEGFNKTIEEQRQQKIDDYITEEKAKIANRIQHEITALLERKQQVEEIIKDKTDYVESLLEQIRSINKTLDDQQQRAKTYETQLRENAQEVAQTYEQDLLKIAEERVANKQEEMLKAAKVAYVEAMAELGAQAEAARAQLETLTKEVAEYSAKQAAINEAILRQRALDEQQDFFRVCLTEEALSDVTFLREVRRNLKKPEIIDKIIYDNYISKPVLEMIKRVLQNSTCSGIYKITCIKTGEIYIGKSTDVKNRWQQHCKTVFNCGTIASSLLHTKMKQHGIENFTFELLENVPKDQLSEREKFYINFYQTKEVGLNERNG